MPELPEVEIVRRELQALCGAKILRIASSDRRVFRERARAAGRTIRAVTRRGKWLRVELDRGVMFSHLGMTGDWTVRDADEAALPFERVRIDVELRRKIASARYTDPRRFGRLLVVPGDIPEWQALGRDPLSEGIDEAHLAQVMKKRRSAVKVVLMDQSLLPGVGNIIATEALFRARIDPRAPSRSMNERDVHAIAKALDATIRRMLAYDEAILEDPEAEAPFRVYGHAGEPCPRCGKKLRRLIVGGRGTTFCAGCQRAAPG